MYRNHRLRTYPQDRGGLSGEDLERHILAMSQGVDILKDGPISIPLDPLLYDDPQFEARRPQAGASRKGSFLSYCAPYPALAGRGTSRPTFWRGDYSDPTAPKTEGLP